MGEAKWRWENRPREITGSESVEDSSAASDLEAACKKFEHVFERAQESVNTTRYNYLTENLVSSGKPTVTVGEVIESALKPMEDKMSTELQKQTKELKRQADELERQSNAQASIDRELSREFATRSKDDKKYFWLGVVCSFVISMLVEHGAELIQFLQQLFQQ